MSIQEPIYRDSIGLTETDVRDIFYSNKKDEIKNESKYKLLSSISESALEFLIEEYLRIGYKLVSDIYINDNKVYQVIIKYENKGE